MKIFVLDTSVLLHDPRSLYAFKDNVVIIPIAVIEEIDSMRKRSDEVGRNARQVSRNLDSLRSFDRLNEGVKCGEGIIRVELNHQQVDALPFGFDKSRIDNRILAVAMALGKEMPSTSVIVVTKDINMRVKSDALGILSEDYTTDKVPIDELPTGVFNIIADDKVIDKFYREERISISKDLSEYSDLGIMPNEFVLLEGSGPGKSALARFSPQGDLLQPLYNAGGDVWGVRPRNKAQKFAMDLLLDDNIKLVILIGTAGTGKTLLALAAGLRKVLDEHVYRKLLVTRPVVPIGHDIGFLPGEKDDKLRPWMQPVYDNLEYLFSNRDKKEGIDKFVSGLKDMNILEFEALTYIRGRSIPKQFIIVDEAQNLSPHEVKTIITRCGEGTKIVLTGDPYQIDHPYLDSSSNGLTYAVQKFRAQPIAGSLLLTKGERSELAEIAARIM